MIARMTPNSSILGSATALRHSDEYSTSKKNEFCIPFPEEFQLCSELDSANDSELQKVLRLPGQPRIRMGDDARLWQYLEREFYSPDLERMAPRLWLMSTQSSANISALHRQRVKNRRIIITEDPQLHLVWVDDRIFIKPLPLYLLSHVFWNKYLQTDHYSIMRNSSSCSDGRGIQQQRVVPAALGFLRTYSHLIQHESDFQIAKDERLIPADVTWMAFSDLSSSVMNAVHDAEVSGRYAYGELRLSRLNFYSKIFLHRFYLHRLHAQYGSYFAQFFAPILFVFGMLSVALSAMQVVTATEALLSVKGTWRDFWQLCRWASVLALLLIVSIFLVLVLLFLYRFASEWFYAVRKRIGKRRVERRMATGSIV